MRYCLTGSVQVIQDTHLGFLYFSTPFQLSSSTLSLLAIYSSFSALQPGFRADTSFFTSEHWGLCDYLLSPKRGNPEESQKSFGKKKFKKGNKEKEKWDIIHKSQREKQNPNSSRYFLRLCLKLKRINRKKMLNKKSSQNILYLLHSGFPYINTTVLNSWQENCINLWFTEFTLF